MNFEGHLEINFSFTKQKQTRQMQIHVDSTVEYD